MCHRVIIASLSVALGAASASSGRAQTAASPATFHLLENDHRRHSRGASREAADVPSPD